MHIMYRVYTIGKIYGLYAAGIAGNGGYCNIVILAAAHKRVHAQYVFGEGIAAGRNPK